MTVESRNDFFETKSIGTANRMWRHQQDNASLSGQLGTPIEACFDVPREVTAWLQAILIEPHLVTSRFQVCFDPDGEFDRFVMTITQKDTHCHSGLCDGKSSGMLLSEKDLLVIVTKSQSALLSS
jgi:hypothetical protein